ncbi:MAG: hypothetical protein QMB24_07050 [Spirosomataceae bacterium]
MRDTSRFGSKDPDITKVIRHQNGVAPAYNTLEHSTGYCSISLEPRQNQ